MKKRKSDFVNLTIILLFVFIVALSVFNLIQSFMVLDEWEVYTSVGVSDHPGFDLNTTALTFGLVQPRGSAERSINLTNNFDEPVLASISANGEIAEFLIVSENDFVLESGEERKVQFFLEIPDETSFGDYDGNLVFSFRRHYG